MIQDITAIITNYKTEHLVKQAVESLLGFYPGLRLIVIDNGSKDASTEYIKGLKAKYVFGISTILNPDNFGHGPAMHQGMQLIRTKYAFLMDTDCVVERHGFLELMYDWFQHNDNLYALGWLRCVDKWSGVSTDECRCLQGAEGFCWYVHPCAALIDRDKYFTLEPFQHEGAPCIKNMRDVATKGYDLEWFPVFDYIEHLSAGTRRMWGGAWDVGDSKPISEWNANDNYPI